MSNHKALICTDFSNFLYYTICGSVSAWLKEGDNSKYLKPANETDQDNLPDLLVYPDFIRTLNNFIHKRLDTVNWIARQNHQDELDCCTGIDVVFTMDDNINNNFRKQRYPGYKAQRKLVRKRYDVNKIKEYVTDVILPGLKLEDDYGYNFIKVEGCESDDIIATIFRNFNDYELRILISSDHDFLQLENVHQYDMAGNPIRRVVCDRELDAKNFLLWKIIRGDVSDNISGVFKGVGEKKALKLVSDKQRLKVMLKESQDAANQYTLNKYLIDFNSIPKDLEDKICREVRSKIKTSVKLEDDLIGSVDDMLNF